MLTSMSEALPAFGVAAAIAAAAAAIGGYIVYRWIARRRHDDAMTLKTA
jgi:Tfp pilus assembly major pilin PilA